MNTVNELTNAINDLNRLEKDVQEAYKKGLLLQYGIYGYSNISETIDILKGELDGNHQYAKAKGLI